MDWQGGGVRGQKEATVRGKAAPQPWAQALENKVGHDPPVRRTSCEVLCENILHFQRGYALNQALPLLLLNPMVAPRVLL